MPPFRHHTREEISAHIERLRTSYGQPYGGRFDMTKPIDKLKVAMLEQTHRLEPLAKELRRWTPVPNPERDRDKVGKSLDGSDLDAYPAEHVERKRRAALVAFHAADSNATGILRPLASEALGEHSDRSTQLDAAHRSETSLLVEEFRGRTRQEQADLVDRGRRAVARGDLQMALAHLRAAQGLRVPAPELEQGIAAIDPEHKAARIGTQYVEKLVGVWQGDSARRRVQAGVADKTEEVGWIGWAHEQGFAQKGDGRPYVEQVLGE